MEKKPSNPIRSASLSLSCTFIRRVLRHAHKLYETYKWTTTVDRSAFRPFKFTVLGGRMETAAGRAQLICNKSCLHANLPPGLPFACLPCVSSSALGALRKNPSGSVQKATAGTVDPPRIWSIWAQHKRMPHCGASWSGRHGLRASAHLVEWLCAGALNDVHWTDCRAERAELTAATCKLRNSSWKFGMDWAAPGTSLIFPHTPCQWVVRSSLHFTQQRARPASTIRRSAWKIKHIPWRIAIYPSYPELSLGRPGGFARSSGSCCWQASA